MAHSEHAYLGISHDLTYTLAELYFETAYNASLLLHKASFLASLAAGTACPHVVLSVCAWAAKYVRINIFLLIKRLTVFTQFLPRRKRRGIIENPRLHDGVGQTS